MAPVSSSARDAILAGVQAALGRGPGEPALPVPASARVPARDPGCTGDEMAMLLEEIAKVGGRTRRVTAETLGDALADLVQAEGIRVAALWQTPEVKALNVSAILEALGVEIVPAGSGKHALAGCDLGVTGVDMALPETGTLVLRTSAVSPRAISLLPRVHLALVRPEDLRPDVTSAFEKLPAHPNCVFVTGPSRTADIELTVTIGVHGPQVLVVWVVGQS
jgi:L-lactate dehydrogenase complex protein LldG